MTNGGGEFPIGKLVSFMVVLGLTAFPVVSCGPLEFQGHEILRNQVPDFEGALSEGLGDMGKAFGASGSGGLKVKPSASPTVTPKRDQLFPPAQQWMWFLYMAAFAAGLISIFLAGGSRARAALGAFGAVALFVFLSNFENALMAGEGEQMSGVSMFEWDTGAYVAMVGFVLMLFDGLRTPTPTRGRRSAAWTSVNVPAAGDGA